MSVPARQLVPNDADHDNIVVIRNATWADFERMRDIRDDGSVPRLAYFEGALELIRPSRVYERSGSGDAVRSRSSCCGAIPTYPPLRVKPLPGIDLAQLASFAEERPMTRAVRSYLRALRSAKT